MEVIIITALLGLFGAVILYVSKIFSKTGETIENENVVNEQIVNDKPRKKSESSTSKKNSGSSKVATKEKNFEHKWLLTTLKGHQSSVLSMDISPNDKFLASSCENRSLILWPTKHFIKKDHKIVRGNVAFDHGLHIAWSPDGKALIVHKEVSR